MRSLFAIAALSAVAFAGPTSTSNVMGNPNEANYDPMAKGASYRYVYHHGADTTGAHAAAHHHTRTLFLSEEAASDAMEEVAWEAPENCADDVAVDCVAAFVEGGCPEEGYDGGADCADYAACNGNPALCTEVVMLEGEEAEAAASTLDTTDGSRNPVGYSQFRCDPAGRGEVGPEGECICDEGTQVVVVGVVGKAKLYEIEPSTTEFGNANAAYFTCIPDVANSPRVMPQEGDAADDQAESSAAVGAVLAGALFAAVSL